MRVMPDDIEGSSLDLSSANRDTSQCDPAPVGTREVFFAAIFEANLKTPQFVNGTSTFVLGRLLMNAQADGEMALSTLVPPPSAEELETLLRPMTRAHLAYNVQMDAATYLVDFVRMYQNQILVRLARLIDQMDETAPILGISFELKWTYQSRYPFANIENRSVAARIDKYFCGMRDSNHHQIWAKLGAFLENVMTDAELQSFFSDFRKAIKTNGSTEVLRTQTKAEFHELMGQRLREGFGYHLGMRIYTALYE